MPPRGDRECQHNLRRAQLHFQEAGVHGEHGEHGEQPDEESAHHTSENYEQGEISRAALKIGDVEEPDEKERQAERGHAAYQDRQNNNANPVPPSHIRAPQVTQSQAAILARG